MKESVVLVRLPHIVFPPSTERPDLVSEMECTEIGRRRRIYEGVDDISLGRVRMRTLLQTRAYLEVNLYLQ